LEVIRVTTEERPPEWVIDPDKPSVARMYDYYLGGKDNFAADRAAADRVVQALPNVLEFTRANRTFLSQVVTLLAERGIRQFLDIGSGLPTQENVHEVAHRNAPDAHVVYVDHDPIVLTHARALLIDSPQTKVVQGDLRDPEAILTHEVVQAQIDFDRPVAVLLVAILHFIRDDAQAAEIVARLRERMVRGSYLVVSHGYAGDADKDTEHEVRSAYAKTAAGDIVPRTREQILGYFEGMELLGPGLVQVGDWRPEDGPVESDLSKVGFLGAVGKVP
jgi:SAM-dependent methyltransferase